MNRANWTYPCIMCGIRSKRRERCLACADKNRKERQARTVSKARNYSKAWYAKNKDSQYRHWLKRMYGITMEFRDELISKQEGKCGICGVSLASRARKNVHVDHCHSTQVVRGILCNHCNAGIGHFGDSINILKNAISYIERYAGATMPTIPFRAGRYRRG